MILRSLIPIFFVVITMSSLYGQKEDFQWVFGDRYVTFPPIYYGSVVDFNNTPVAVEGRLDGIESFNGSNTAISSEGGQLLFYTNGVQIYDRRHTLMKNGDTLSPTELTYFLIEEEEGSGIEQNVLVLPWPGRDSTYFLMHHNTPYRYSTDEAPEDRKSVV